MADEGNNPKDPKNHDPKDQHPKAQREQDHGKGRKDRAEAVQRGRVFLTCQLLVNALLIAFVANFHRFGQEMPVSSDWDGFLRHTRCSWKRFCWCYRVGFWESWSGAAGRVLAVCSGER